MLCLVCSVPISVSHLGVDVCRACAAFFKRTTIAGRSYTCIQSEGKCAFRKHEEFMCKSCRHDRCIELGMRYVEPRKRRPRGKKEDKTLPSLPRTIPIRDSVIDRMAAPYRDLSTFSIQSSSTASMLNFSYFRSALDRRLVREREYVAANDLQLLDHPSAELYTIHFTVYKDMLRISVSESKQILEEAFNLHGGLSTSDKTIPHQVTLFKNFFGKLRFLEMLYFSSQLFDKNSIYMVSLTTYVNTNNVDEWVTVKDEVERKDELRAFLCGFAEEYLVLIQPMLRMCKLTEREFHALLVLAFCDNVIGLPLTVETFENLEKIRMRVVKEMQDFYRNELRLMNFSKRLGNLMIIAHGIGEAGIVFSKELRIYHTMFDLFANDQLIRETFLN